MCHVLCMCLSLWIRIQGLKFPWESAVSGQEVCPMDSYGKQEIHINGDVALAFRHYLYLTQVNLYIMLNHSKSACWAKLFKNPFMFPSSDRTLKYLSRVGPVKWCGV